MDSFSDLAVKCGQLVKDLNWQTYHTPENLAAILVGEIGELSEICVWFTKDQILKNHKINENVQDELSDLVIAVLFLYNSLHLDITIETLVSSKLKYENIQFRNIRTSQNTKKWILRLDQKYFLCHYQKKTLKFILFINYRI